MNSASDNRLTFAVRTLAGFEGLLRTELSALGVKRLSGGTRFVEIEGTKELLYRACYHSRYAVRVLRPLAQFAAPSEKEFYDVVREIPWEDFLRPSGSLVVKAEVNSGFTTHSLYLAQLTKDAVVDRLQAQFGTRPSVDKEHPELTVFATLSKGRAYLALDAAGGSLHRRGYRSEAGVAPLGEVLGAGLVALTPWQPGEDLLDPMCGSGTLVIEAALRARNIAPGSFRQKFGFEFWKDFEAPLLSRIKDEARAAELPWRGPKLRAEDRDPQAVAMAKRNAARARVVDCIDFAVRDFLVPSGGIALTSGVLITNPPYDERLSTPATSQFYAGLGDSCRRHALPGRSYVFSAYRGAAAALGIPRLTPQNSLALRNGALECFLLEVPGQPRHCEPVGRSNPSEPSSNQRDFFAALAMTRTGGLAVTDRLGEFKNRLEKNFKHLARVAKRDGVENYRLYYKDIPEFPFIVDKYGEWVHVGVIRRNNNRSPREQAQYLQGVAEACALALGIPAQRVVIKLRERGAEPLARGSENLEAQEHGRRFWINLHDYTEVGLFLEQRAWREHVAETSRGRSVLNLFGYTGALSVYAATSGARSTTTVEASRIYCDWAAANFELNGMAVGDKHRILKEDVFEFLKNCREKFDLVLVDPPAISTNRRLGTRFEISRDFAELWQHVQAVTKPSGQIQLWLESPEVPPPGAAKVEDLTASLRTFDCGKSFSFKAYSLSN